MLLHNHRGGSTQIFPTFEKMLKQHPFFCTEKNRLINPDNHLQRFSAPRTFMHPINLWGFAPDMNEGFSSYLSSSLLSYFWDVGDVPVEVQRAIEAEIYETAESIDQSGSAG